MNPAAAAEEIQTRSRIDPGTIVLVLACAAVALLALQFAREYHFNVVDDAYISFQYAKNWALGRGLVFNPGERVEGYTNFLWVAMLTPLIWFSRALSLDFTTLAIGLNLGLAILNLVITERIARTLFGGRWLPAVVAVSLLALDNAYQVYAMSGLENSLLSTCLLAALWAFLRERSALVGLALALAAMTRPDALLFGATLGVVVLASRSLPRPLRAMAVFVAVYGTYFLARTAYYGDVVPNTFHVKVGSGMDAWARGLEYTLGFLAQRLFLPAVAVLAPIVIRRAWAVWLSAYLLLHAVYVCYVGGDFYGGYRFFVGLLPLFALLLAGLADAGFRALAGRPRLRSAAVAVVSIGAVAYAWMCFRTGPYRGEVVRWGSVVDDNVHFNRWLATRFAPGTSMVVGDIGAPGFFADLRVFDVFGIVDPVVARQKPAAFGKGKPGHEKVASEDYLLSRHPDLVKWGYVHRDLRPLGYYVFTDFPASVNAQGLWVKDDLLSRGHKLETVLSFDDAKGWELSGDARFWFGPGQRNGQQFVTGNTGAFLDSYVPAHGDASTGRMVSPEFALEGTHLVLNIGGGRDPEKLKVALLVDGQEVRTATGHGAEVLGRRIWDVTPWRGRQARLLVEDQSTAAWGHLLLDDVESWEIE